MGEKHLHIITHDVPYPADYGGVIDIFYKIKSLHQLGVKIYLHCFVYDRLAADELNKYCEEVIYYKRKNDIFHFSFIIPFIVNSRKSSDLIYNLKLDNHPILIEGIHCSYYAAEGQLYNRIVLLRLFNTEFVYYKQLALHEKNWFKKFYYQHESKLLKKYENNLSKQLQIAALSEQDVHLYKQFFNAENIFFLSVFFFLARISHIHFYFRFSTSSHPLLRLLLDF